MQCHLAVKPQISACRKAERGSIPATRGGMPKAAVAADARRH